MSLLLLGNIALTSSAAAFVMGPVDLSETTKSDLVHKVAVFGKDDRKLVPGKYSKLKSQIGLLYDQYSQTRCTAFCVAPNVIATAAHCLFGASPSQRPNASNFFFRINASKKKSKVSRIAGFQNRSSERYIVTGTTRLQTHPPMNSPQDWSLVRLRHPICQARSLEVKPQSREKLLKASADQQIFQIAYHWDFERWKLAYSGPCSVKKFSGKISWREVKRLFISADSLVFHDCDTGGASSGSPILMNSPKGPVVVGINVGSYEQIVTSSAAKKKRIQTKIIANTAVNASAFFYATEILREAKLIEKPDSLRAVQTWLKTDGFYKGRIDGVYGPRTRAAIVAYQTRRKLPVTGLPTQDLLANTVTLGKQLPWLDGDEDLNLEIKVVPKPGEPDLTGSNIQGTSRP